MTVKQLCKFNLGYITPRTGVGWGLDLYLEEVELHVWSDGRRHPGLPRVRVALLQPE